MLREFLSIRTASVDIYHYKEKKHKLRILVFVQLLLIFIMALLQAENAVVRVFVQLLLIFICRSK